MESKSLIKYLGGDNAYVDDFIAITYSPTYVGEKTDDKHYFSEMKYTESIWNHPIGNENIGGYSGTGFTGCRHCGYGNVVWAIVKLDNGNYGFCDVWNGCLSYGMSGKIFISNSLEDLLDICLTKNQEEQYRKDKNLI